MVDVAEGFYQLFGPGYRFAILETAAKPSCISGDRGARVQVAMIGRPPKGGTQIGQLDREPEVRLALARAVPKVHDVGFPFGEVARVGGPNLGCFAAGDELFLGKLADGF